MIKEKRMALYLVLLSLLLAGLCCWSAGLLSSARQEKLSAEADLARCRQIAGVLSSLQNRPAMLGGSRGETEELSRQVESAAQKASIPSQSIIRIWPEPARRVGESVYKEKPTQILLRKVSMQQIAGFLYALTGEGDVLSAKSIRLTPLQGDEGAGAGNASNAANPGNTWTADVSVSYFVYDPPKEATQ